MKIHSLLNPSCGEDDTYRCLESPGPAVVPCPSPPNAMPTRQKISKDAPIFSEGNRIVGFVNYPPHEAGDNKALMTEHERFQVFPLGEIYRKGVRHIPYNSDKKDFLDKTGRDAFDVFQYTYKVPGDEKDYVVVWDYNVGLVRMTPFFKSCKYTKTIPAKALKENPGLKDITYSITGGALVCQGYWMPYQAAKAVAATFCYHIRWALTPVFGNDFPSMCLTPKAPTFAKFYIDPAIVQYCTSETDRFRTEGATYRISTTDAYSPTEKSKLELASPPWEIQALKQGDAQPIDLTGIYEIETNYNDKCTSSPEVSPLDPWTPMTTSLSPRSFSPHVSPRSHWTFLNRPLSPLTPTTTTSSATCSPTKTHALPLIREASPISDEQCSEQFRTKRSHSKIMLSEYGDEQTMTRSQTAGAVNSDSVLDVDSVSNASFTSSDIGAAEILLLLSSGCRTSLPPTKRTRRGSTM